MYFKYLYISVRNKTYIMGSCIKLQTFYRQLIFIDIYKKIYKNKFLMIIDILKRSKIFQNYTMYIK